MAYRNQQQRATPRRQSNGAQPSVNRRQTTAAPSQRAAASNRSRRAANPRQRDRARSTSPRRRTAQPAGARPRRTQPARKSPAILIIALAAVVIVGFGVVSCVNMVGSWLFPPEQAVAEKTDASTETETEQTQTEPIATSTPKDQWKKGTVPELFQTDPAWADEPYAGGTIAENGCGVTCMAMVYIALTGNTDMGPVEMAAFSEENGYAEGGGTPWRFMSDGGAQLGLTVETLPNVAKRITDALDAGSPVIVNVGPGTFTTVGHYIVLTATDGDDRVYIHNPNAPEDDETSWDLATIMNEARNYWAFSA